MFASIDIKKIYCKQNVHHKYITFTVEKIKHFEL